MQGSASSRARTRSGWTGSATRNHRPKCENSRKRIRSEEAGRGRTAAGVDAVRVGRARGPLLCEELLDALAVRGAPLLLVLLALLRAQQLWRLSILVANGIRASRREHAITRTGQSARQAVHGGRRKVGKGVQLLWGDVHMVKQRTLRRSEFACWSVLYLFYVNRLRLFSTWQTTIHFVAYTMSFRLEFLRPSFFSGPKSAHLRLSQEGKFFSRVPPDERCSCSEAELLIYNFTTWPDPPTRTRVLVEARMEARSSLFAPICSRIAALLNYFSSLSPPSFRSN